MLPSITRRIFLLLPQLFAIGMVLRAEPRLPHLFSDHMVLQRGTEVRIWGWADAGEPIEVRLAGVSGRTITARDGRWTVSLPALAAGGPFVLEVHGKKSLWLKDVMIGEVWVASGQSNMTYALSGAANAAEEIPKANDPDLRSFTVPKEIALEPQLDTLPAAWEVSSSDTAKRFSAVAYFFARDLRRSLGVPVGVILSSWPGTQAEEWAAPELLRADVVLRPIASRWDSASPEAKQFAATARRFSLEFDDFELLPAKADSVAVSLDNFDQGAARKFPGSAWSYSWQDAPDSAFELVAPGRGGHGYAARISGALSGANESRWVFRARPDGAPVDLATYAGVRITQYTLPPLATIEMSQAELARTLFHALLQDVQRKSTNQKGTEYVLKTNLVLRESTALNAKWSGMREREVG